MANPEHLKILKQGVSSWNEWREKNREVRPDLVQAHLGGADLGAAGLRGKNSYPAILTNADLRGAKYVLLERPRVAHT